jgi:serine protease
VAGLNRDGFKNNYSNFGAELMASGIATVAGDDVDGAWGTVLADSGLTTLTNTGNTAPLAGGYARLYGTSFAAPQVAGTIALMLSLNPTLSYTQILDGLRLSARPHATSPRIGSCSASNPGRCMCTTATCGVGILDAEQALIYASLPGSYVVPPRQAAVIDNIDIDRALALASQDRPANGAAPPPAAGGDSGGGAFGVFWLMALATAATCVGATRRARV